MTVQDNVLLLYANSFPTPLFSCGDLHTHLKAAGLADGCDSGFRYGTDGLCSRIGIIPVQALLELQVLE
jgi:hypothetical protein